MTSSRDHLLGVALVVDDRLKGPKLAFRYPFRESIAELGSAEFARLFVVRPSEGGGAGAADAENNDSPTGASSSNVLELSIDNFLFLSAPAFVKRAASGVAMFSVVLILDREYEEMVQADPSLHVAPARNTYGAMFWKAAAFERAVTTLTRALAFEEERDGTVSREAQSMLAIKEELRTVPTTMGESRTLSRQSSVSVASHAENALRRDEVYQYDEQSHIDVSLEKSALARCLKDIYHQMCEDEMVDVKINGEARLTLSLQSPRQFPTHPVRPYQTLLLNNARKLLSNHLASRADPSPQMRAMAEYFHRNGPLKSFEEASCDLNISIETVFKLAAHLVHWKRAKVIDTLNQHNIYQVSPTANFDPCNPYMLEFSAKFGNKMMLVLPQILALFSAPKSVSHVITSAETALGLRANTFLKILVWMLQRNLLVQLHWYVHFLPPASSSSSSVSGLDDMELGARGDGASIVGDDLVVLEEQTSGASKELAAEVVVPGGGGGDAQQRIVRANERRRKEANEARQNQLGMEYMNRIADDSPVYKLFQKLCPYFRGRMHIEEIMWRENVSRDDLGTVLEIFRDVLVKSLHL